MANINEIEVDEVLYDIESKKLSTPRKIKLKGEASGSTTFDGSQDISIEVKIDDSYATSGFTNLSATSYDGIKNVYFYS